MITSSRIALNSVRAIRFCAIVVVLLMLAVPEARAALITVENRFSEGFFDSVPDNVLFTQQTSSGAPVTESNTFNSGSSRPPEGPGLPANTGSTASSATATGAFDANGLRMGASGSATVGVSGNTTQYVSQALGYVQFDDTITLLGGVAGTPGFLRLIFDVDGMFSAAVTSAVASGASATLTLNGGISGSSGGLLFADLSSVVGGAIGTPIEVSTGIPVPDPFTVDLSATLGISTPLFLQLFAQFTANFGEVNGPGTASGAVDFASTFTLLSAQVLDAGGNVIPGGTVLSADGFTYVTGPSAVPAPPTVVLLAVGLAGVGTLSRWTQRRSVRARGRRRRGR